MQQRDSSLSKFEGIRGFEISRKWVMPYHLKEWNGFCVFGIVQGGLWVEASLLP